MSDTSVGAWLAPRLADSFTIARHVPSGFAAYARICHPPSDHAGKRVDWSHVAGATSRVAHPLMQWHALVGSSDCFNFTGSLWRGEHPSRGNLAPDVLVALCKILADHTAEPARCFFGLWVGWGWVASGGSRLVMQRVGDQWTSTHEDVPPAFSPEQLGRASLRVYGQDYLIFGGPLSAADQLGDRDEGLGFIPQSPNLLWPADRAWFAATVIDFDSTVVGGSAQLIDAIVGAPQLDAWPIDHDDSLTYDADRVNSVPEGPSQLLGSFEEPPPSSPP